MSHTGELQSAQVVSEHGCGLLKSQELIRAIQTPYSPKLLIPQLFLLVCLVSILFAPSYPVP